MSLVVAKVLATSCIPVTAFFDSKQVFFAELWKRTEHLAACLPSNFVQVNLSYSRPFVVRGRVFDVAVDIRRGSPHFGRWVAAELGPGEALWIPPGFAHGFQALEETHFLYLVTKEYYPQRDKCIRRDDTTIAVKWPAPDKAILSQKDRNCPPLEEAENNFEYL